MKYKYTTLSLLFMLFLICSLVLSLQEVPPICNSGCDLVQTSVYATTFGIKNSIYAIPLFALLFALALTQIHNKNNFIRKIITTATFIGTLIALYFIYLQTFILNAYCTYCLIIDLGLIIALIISLQK